MKALECEAREEVPFCLPASLTCRQVIYLPAPDRDGEPAEGIAGATASPCIAFHHAS